MIVPVGADKPRLRRSVLTRLGAFLPSLGPARAIARVPFGVYWKVIRLRERVAAARPSRAFVVLAFVLAGCGGSSDSIDKPPPPGVAERCGEHVKAEALWFRASDGNLLDGALLGQGERGIVLAHGYPGDVCGELGTGQWLAQRGFRVLVFDFRGYGLSPRAPTHEAINRLSADLQGASELLRDRGATKVFLVGESFGGSAVVGSEPRLDPAPDGVVSLGGPADLSFAGFGPDLNGLAAAREIRAPLLILAGREDGHVDVGDLRTIVRRAPTEDKRLLLYPGHYHAGALLFDAPYRARPRAALLEFLRTR